MVSQGLAPDRFHHESNHDMVAAPSSCDFEGVCSELVCSREACMLPVSGRGRGRWRERERERREF